LVEEEMKIKRKLNFHPQGIIVDVDGTLTDPDGFLNLDAAKYIRILEKYGIMVMLASGNALPVTKALSDYIGCSGPVIAEDGGVIFSNEKIIVNGSNYMARQALLKLRENFGERVIESYSNPFRYTDVAIKRTIPIEDVRKVVSQYPDLKVVDSKFAYHIHNKSIDKGLGFKIACELISKDPKLIIAIGDSELDIPMFKLAGYSVATNNAPEEVKEVTDCVTSKAFGEGFIEFVKYMLKTIKK